MTTIPDRLFNGSGVAASEPGAEREYEAAEKPTKRRCGRCGAQWTTPRDTCGRCALVGPALGRALAHYEAVCTHRTGGSICGVVEVVHGSRVVGGWLGYEFICSEHSGGNVPCDANAWIAANIAARIDAAEVQRPARLMLARKGEGA